MRYESIQDLIQYAGGSVYRLVRMASNRALEISEGKPSLLEKPFSEKATSIALEEILNGKIMYVPKKNKN